MKRSSRKSAVAGGVAIPKARYEENFGEISLHMSHFLLGYLREIHRQFDGDLTLAIVLAEIAHHTMAGHFDTSGLGEGAAASFDSDPEFRRQLPACNAFSLATATGLPRETIRRKILLLEQRGWVERGPSRSVRITPKVAQHFKPGFNLQLLAGLLTTADRIRPLL